MSVICSASRHLILVHFSGRTPVRPALDRPRPCPRAENGQGAAGHSSAAKRGEGAEPAEIAQVGVFSG